MSHIVNVDMSIDQSWSKVSGSEWETTCNITYDAEYFDSGDVTLHILKVYMRHVNESAFRREAGMVSINCVFQNQT